MPRLVTDRAALDIPADFQTGVNALGQIRPAQPVEVIGEADNMLVVRLGSYRASQFRDDYKHETYEVFARILRDFPEWNGNRKGFATVPPLERTSGSLNNNPWTQPAEDVVEEVTGQTAQLYSWDWSGVQMDEPEDMAYAHDLAQRMLTYG